MAASFDLHALREPGRAASSTRCGRGSEPRLELVGPPAAERRVVESRQTVAKLREELAKLDAQLSTQQTPGHLQVPLDVTEAGWHPDFLPCLPAPPVADPPWRRSLRPLGWAALALGGALVGLLVLGPRLTHSSTASRGVAGPIPSPEARPTPEAAASTAPAPPVQTVVSTLSAAPRQETGAASGRKLEAPRALLRDGRLAEAAQAFSSALAKASERYGFQVLVACEAVTVERATQLVDPGEMFVLPVRHGGRSCYRLGWGLYETKAAAEAARHRVPDYFADARLVQLDSLLLQ